MKSPRKLGEPTRGFEPRTPSLRVLYRPGKSGKEGEARRADARIRTADPFITSEVLYQLSYVGGGGSF